MTPLIIRCCFFNFTTEGNHVHTLDKKKKYFFKIEIIKNLKDIELKGFSKIIKLDIPTSINSLIKKIYNLFSDFSLEINGAKFYPLKQSLVYKDKETLSWKYSFYNILSAFTL